MRKGGKRGSSSAATVWGRARSSAARLQLGNEWCSGNPKPERGTWSKRE